VDLDAMRIVPFFPPLAQRAAEMRRDVVRSILRKRFDPRAPARCKTPAPPGRGYRTRRNPRGQPRAEQHEADFAQQHARGPAAPRLTARPVRRPAGSMKALFAVAFDRGRRVRSAWLDLGASPAHRALLADMAYGPAAAQRVALEALEFAREGWGVRQLAVQARHPPARPVRAHARSERGRLEPSLGGAALCGGLVGWWAGGLVGCWGSLAASLIDGISLARCSCTPGAEPPGCVM